MLYNCNFEIELEKFAIDNGILAKNDKIYFKSTVEIGASNGSSTQFTRIDFSGGQFHGHPVTSQ